jgi:radical SAM enzyme (rSAM/lipoprotein system)
MPNKFAQFFYNQFKKNEAKLHELSYLFWECTRRCNLQCRHCGSDCTGHSGEPDMPFADFLNAILPLKNVYNPEKISVAITGGEPLLHRDLFRCGKTLREHGFHWGIVTNGYGYTPAIHDKLIASGMESLTISIDGFEDTHNRMRGKNNSFKNAVRALELITGADRLFYDVVTCVNKKNIRELPDFREFLISKNVRAWRLFTIAPIGRAANDGDMLLNGEELKFLMEFIAKARTEKCMNVEFSCEAYTGKYETSVRDSLFFCRAGINIASILIDGSISACPNINRNFVQGNIYKDDFLDVWTNRFDVMRNRKWTKTGLCLKCKDYKNCTGGAMHLWDEKRDTPLTCINQKMTQN